MTAGDGVGDDLKQRIIDAVKTVYDPEIPVNIWEVGLIYDVQVDANGRATVTMTLTSPMCPVAESLPVEVEQKVSAVNGVTTTKVDVVWDPPWDPDMMSEAAKLELGMF